MSEHTDNNKSINETLSVIRKALQEDNFDDNNEEDVLLLNQLVKEDGTIESIDNGNIKKPSIPGGPSADSTNDSTLPGKHLVK